MTGATPGGVIEGFDVSRFQSGAYAGGGNFSFGWAKASEGNGFADAAYGTHVAAIRANGLVPGAYHFARPDLGNTPEAEADWFLSVVGDPRGMLLSLDLETGLGRLAEWRDRFCDRVQAVTGGPCWWYSFDNFIRTRALNTPGTPFPLWLAWPNPDPLPVYAFGPARMQQWGLTSVPGIPGDVDANRFFGTLDELRALTVGGVTVPPPPPQEDFDMGDIAYVDVVPQMGQQHALWTDAAGRLNHHWYAGEAGWRWETLATGLAPRAPVTAVARDEIAQFQVWARGADGRVWHGWAPYGGGWSSEWRGDPDGGLPGATIDLDALAAAIAARLPPPVTDQHIADVAAAELERRQAKE